MRDISPAAATGHLCRQEGLGCSPESTAPGGGGRFRAEGLEQGPEAGSAQQHPSTGREDQAGGGQGQVVVQPAPSRHELARHPSRRAPSPDAVGTRGRTRSRSAPQAWTTEARSCAPRPLGFRRGASAMGQGGMSGAGMAGGRRPSLSPCPPTVEPSLGPALQTASSDGRSTGALWRALGPRPAAAPSPWDPRAREPALVPSGSPQVPISADDRETL